MGKTVYPPFIGQPSAPLLPIINNEERNNVLNSVFTFNPISYDRVMMRGPLERTKSLLSIDEAKTEEDKNYPYFLVKNPNYPYNNSSDPRRMPKDVKHLVDPDYPLAHVSVYYNYQNPFSQAEVKAKAKRYNDIASRQSVMRLVDPEETEEFFTKGSGVSAILEKWNNLPRYLDKIKKYEDENKKIFEKKYGELNNFLTPEFLAAIGMIETKLIPQKGGGRFQNLSFNLPAGSSGYDREEYLQAKEKAYRLYIDLDNKLKKEYGKGIADFPLPVQHSIMAANWNVPAAAKQISRRGYVYGMPMVIGEPTQLVTMRHATLVPYIYYALTKNDPGILNKFAVYDIRMLNSDSLLKLAKDLSSYKDDVNFVSNLNKWFGNSKK